MDDSFKNLAKKLKVVRAFEWGVSPVTERSKAIKHVYVSSFASEKDLEAYGASPEHLKHIKVGASITESVSAIDYWQKE